MKKLLMIAVVLVTAAALFTSCGGAADPDKDDTSKTTKSGGNNAGGGNGGGSGGAGAEKIEVPYIFDITALTADCSQEDFTAFFETPGNYKCQHTYSTTEFIGESTAATMTYDNQAEYTITKASIDEPPKTEFTKASSILYIKTPELADSSNQQLIKAMWEDEGYTITFNGDTAVCTRTNPLDYTDDMPLSPGQYAIKQSCKTNADKSKVYLTAEWALGSSYELLIEKK